MKSVRDQYENIVSEYIRGETGRFGKTEDIPSRNTECMQGERSGIRFEELLLFLACPEN
jgi:hypothetical protein